MPPDGPSKAPRVGWALDPELVEQIVQLSRLHHRTISGEATVALKAWVKKHAKELKAAREKT